MTHGVGEGGFPRLSKCLLLPLNLILTKLRANSLIIFRLITKGCFPILLQLFDIVKEPLVAVHTTLFLLLLVFLLICFLSEFICFLFHL